MPRVTRRKLSPWIERLILSYGGPEESGGGGGSSSGRLKAHVIGVGQMSQSQAHGSEGPTGLLFVSDGVLQIPAVLTASSWENLQEKEDRECFSSLVNTTVCMQDYQLQFHMAPEQTKCRFFLVVGELATTAAGPSKDNTPDCTTLPSVRLKIFKTWRSLLGVESQESQRSQCAGFDLSELLGEWQHDCLQSVLEDVRERLKVASPPQPSTSTFTPVLTDAFTATSWDVDRVRFKGEKCLSVPVKSLFIPELHAEQLYTPPNDGRKAEQSAASEDQKRDSSPSGTAQSLDDDVQWRIVTPAVAQRPCDPKDTSAPLADDCMTHEDDFARMVDSDIRLLSNPWDIFPPPCVTSSSPDSSPEVTPTRSLHQPTSSRSDRALILTSTQLPVDSSRESQHTSENSYFPPYQKPPCSTGPCAAASLSTPADAQNAHAAQQDLPPLEQESQEILERRCRKAKRKRSGPTPEASATCGQEEGGVGGSPPSWLFDTDVGREAEDDGGDKRGRTAGTLSRKTKPVHSDGKSFSFVYHVSGQNLEAFSRFKVDDALLKWGLKYLVAPKKNNSSAGASSQTTSDMNEVT